MGSEKEQIQEGKFQTAGRAVGLEQSPTKGRLNQG